MDSSTSLYVLGAVIAGIGVVPIMKYFYSLTKNSDDTEKNISQTKKEIDLNNELKFQKIENELTHQAKEIDELKKKYNNNTEEINEIRVVKLATSNLEKKVETMEISQREASKKLNEVDKKIDILIELSKKTH